MSWQPPRESQFHAPTERCPHPEWWSAWNAVSTEVEASMLVAALVKATQPEFILEVGSHYGQTSERIGHVVIENGHGEFISLDNNPEMIGSASHRCQGLPVYFICADSLKYIPARPIDFLFIDGDEQRSKDLLHFMPYLAPSCVVVVHDTAYYLIETGIILKEWHWDHIELPTPRGLMVLTR